MEDTQEKKHTLLIIEDNEINCEILNEILQDRYHLFFAYNGQEGMEQLQQHYGDIDVVLLDIQMPVMDGYEVLKAKGKAPLLKDIPVIITTSSNGRDDEVRCLGLGAQDFVRKPYDPIVVRLRIQNIINLRESAEINRQKAVFIQNISHEIRTPMNAIMGFSQIMESMGDELSTDDLKMFCGNITSNSHLLMDMINNTVILSDVDSDCLSISISDVSPNQICRDAMVLASYNTPEDVKVYFTSDVEDDFVFSTCPKHLKQAVYNYIVNANKFTKEGEIHIHCSSQAKPGKVQISVSDTGIGVPGEKAEYIFGRFTKLDSFVLGMGIGLAVSRDIAVSLGGSAYLDTAYSGGARFVLELPAGK